MGETSTLQHIKDNRRTLLQGFRQRQAIVRDRVRAVARGYATGFYLYGGPGTAKTHTVRVVLEQEIKEIYTYLRGHLTALGLFEVLGANRDEVIVLDDLGAILQSVIALQILLAALEHSASPDCSLAMRVLSSLTNTKRASRICGDDPQ